MSSRILYQIRRPSSGRHQWLSCVLKTGQKTREGADSFDTAFASISSFGSVSKVSGIKDPDTRDVKLNEIQSLRWSIGWGRIMTDPGGENEILSPQLIRGSKKGTRLTG